MASADELRTQIDEGHAVLKAAFEGADASKWEQVPGSDEEWNARQMAEHVIGGELSIVSGVANTMLGKPPERPELALASPADAVAALESAVEASNKVTRYVEDRDLPKPVGEKGRTIESTLALLGSHATDHAGQISGAT